MRFSYSLLTVGVALTGLLSACGGGGGGTPAASPVALASGNMTVAAQDAAAAAYMPLESSQMLTGAQVTDESLLFSIARDQLDKLPLYMASAKANSTLAGAVATVPPTNCSVSGTLSVSANDADNNGVASAGDSVTITANNCVENYGTLSGSMTFTINALSGTFLSTSYNASVTMAFGNFTVTGPQFSASANGSLTLALNATGANALSSTVSTSSLTVSGTYAGVTRTRSLSSYSATAVRTPGGASGYQTSHTISGTLTSSALNGQSVSFTTPSAFATQGTDHYPSTGQMVITGASGSKLRITALSNTQVNEELDANGDGTYEVGPTTVAWSNLY